MSMDYWAIEGLGLKLNDFSIFDPSKIIGKIKSLATPNKEGILVFEGRDTIYEFDGQITEQDIVEAMTWDEILEDAILPGASPYLGWSDNGYDEYYLLFMPQMPWWVKDSSDWGTISEERAREIVYEALLPLLNSDVTKESIISQIDWISTYGCG